MVFCLPGVPSEAKAIFQESVLPKIRSKAGGRSYAERWFKLSGIMESSLAPIIDKVMSHTPGVYIKSHPRGFENAKPQIELHFSTFAARDSAGIRTIQKAVKEMMSELRQQPAKVRITEQTATN
jgi:molybdopterin-biosynthesis enzyme MoeA-like protein